MKYNGTRCCQVLIRSIEKCRHYTIGYLWEKEASSVLFSNVYCYIEDLPQRLKVARYSFSGWMPPKFEHKLRRHKQCFGKIATTVVLREDENLLWSGLQRHRSCHSNEMTLLPILIAAVYLGTGKCSSKIIHGSLFLQKQPRCSWSLSEICKSVIEILWDKDFLLRNTVKNGQSWCSAVICRKPSAFDMQFHLIVVSIF